MKTNTKENNRIAKISHDLKAPINAIMGYVDLIKHQTQNLNIIKYSQNIIYACESINLLMKELNSFNLNEEDKILTDNINALFDGKKFTSDYARQGLLNDIKTGLNKPENKGKGIQDLFNELIKDKTDIFANPNQMKDMAGMGDSEQDNNTKEIPILW